MRIAVTGGAGFIASHLVDRLAADGAHDIVVIDNLHRGRVAGLPLSSRVSFREVDIRNREALLDAIGGCEVVFHLAAQSNVLGAEAHLDYSFSTNVTGTFHVLTAAKSVGVRRVVFTSSREVYGDPERTPVEETAPLLPKNAYGASKAAAEMYCRVLSDNVTVLRLANVYGPGDRGRVIPIFIDNALRGEPLQLYGGEQVVDFIWVGVVVEALMRAGFGAWIGEPVNIGSGTGITIRELATRIVETIGGRSQLVVMPVREVEVTRFIASTARAQRLLGIQPPEDPLSHLGEVIRAST
jgi:UDP-glucose 4-epimerase